MSDLHKEFLKAKLRRLPLEPPMPPTNQLSELSILSEEMEEEAEDGGTNHGRPPPSPLTDDSSSASSASSTGTIKPLFARPPQPRKKPTFDPIPWQTHFSQELRLTSPDSPNATFHAYFTPPLASPTNPGPLFIFHHGAGSSGLSFALLATSIRRLLPSAGVLSPDCRGHGETVTSDDSDLSLSTLSADLLAMIHLTAQHCGWTKFPEIVLVGHSLGGAVVVDLAASGKLGAALLGYAVLDVVEGSAIDALQSMHTYLSSRPSGFASLSQGIEWHTRSRTLRNPTSARISVPALLTRQADAAEGDSRAWRWRTDLASTQPFWEGWFVGLSRKFLSAVGGKLLILAGTDRLDKELMIGQMQGKYQLLVLPEVGHFVHEDAPEKTAAALVEFYRRNVRSALVLPPKVGDMYRPAAGMHYTSI
ncbi:Alpha/Beta hydrolase protein [Sphaerosporella brunnea]|uniref:Protein phosphatase methylesterase 1 n=1 Tax=Sphaerosporella brunnea TaxID=1250544 RepID=A0A5J5EN21_9PEZI|nr:Alpha/Beta hydrolase protein [Sphaerosporella brunnea]